MTKFEYDKQIAAAMKPLNEKEIQTAKETLTGFLNKKKKAFTSSNNLMLLCNETNYFTIFSKTKNMDTEEIARKIVNFIIEDTFLEELGELKYFEEDQDHIEIWIGEFFFALFDADFMFVDLTKEK
jgi:hypothetical protein